MSVEELKEQLVESIQKSEDERWLESARDYAEAIKDESREPVYKLSDAQRTAIKAAPEKVARGEYYTNEEVEEELDRWFEEEEKKWGEK